MEVEGFADLLCIKREAFDHENEVRLLFQDMNSSSPKKGKNGVFSYPLKPNDVFDEVVLDPRISDLEATKANRQSPECRLQAAHNQI